MVKVPQSLFSLQWFVYFEVQCQEVRGVVVVNIYVVNPLLNLTFNTFQRFLEMLDELERPSLEARRDGSSLLLFHKYIVVLCL